MEQLGFSKIMNNNSILHLAKYSPDEDGGVEKVVKSLMGVTKYEEVICFAKKEQTRCKDLSIKTYKTQLTIANQPISLEYLRNAVKKIHSHSHVVLHAPNYVAMLALFCTSISDKKIITFWHSDVIGKGLLAKLLRPLERYVLNKSTKIICTSEEYLNASQQLRDFRHKLVVLPLGIAPPTLQKDKAFFEEEDEYYVSVGRIVPYKNLERGVKIWSEVHNHKKLCIVGDGKIKKDIEKFALSLNCNVDFLGKLNEEDKECLIKGSAGLILWSNTRAEAYGLVLIEALSMGIPIFSFRNKGSGMIEITKNYKKENIFIDAKSLDLALKDNEKNLEKNKSIAQNVFNELYHIDKFKNDFKKILDIK
jgi:glycosyltransferase involved in cell wall biosynthesis